jgi:SAM-dependent methyltransferase
MCWSGALTAPSLAPDKQGMSNDARQHAPSAARNREPIWNVLRHHLPQHGLVLEVGSGSGEHSVHFARASGPEVVYQPSDPDAQARASIDAWALASGLPNIRPALALDAAADAWPVASADAVLCINMIHISPWASSVGLVRGAGRVLPPGGLLYLYGPYRRGGRHTAPSNEAFDRDFLRARNPEWGVRDVEAVADLAADAGFLPPVIVEMPANNLSVVFRRES